MKTEYRIFSGLALFLFTTAAVYAWWTSSGGAEVPNPGHVEPIGTVALILSGLLCLMCGGYFWFVSRRIDPRPEDRPDAEIADGAGPIGFFSPGSYWPFGVGLTALTLANDPREPTSALAPLTVVGLVAFTVGVVGLLVLIANGWPASRTACLATASGTASAIASVLTQTALLRLADPATGADLVFVAVAVMIIVLAIGGLLLAQAAYATGLGLPLAVLTIANPVTAGAVGLTLFEHPVGPSSAGLLLTALAMLVTSHGVVLLTTSGTSRHHPRYGRRRTAQLPAHTPEDDRP